jgi:hypothetical protein
VSCGSALSNGAVRHEVWFYMISGFCREGNCNCTLLCFYPVSSVDFIPMFGTT